MFQYTIYLLSINNHIFFYAAIMHIHFTVAYIIISNKNVSSTFPCFLFITLRKKVLENKL